MSAPLTRRQALRAATAVGLGLAAGPAPAADAKPRYRVAACDWMLLKRQKLGALPLAKECGMDGVEVDMGSLGDGSDIRNELRKPEVRKQFLDTARDLGIEIHLAMQFDNIQMIKEAVELGSGISILPARTMLAEVEQGRLVAIPLHAPELVRPVGIVHRKRKKFNRAAQSFLELLQEAPEGAVAELAFKR